MYTSVFLLFATISLVLCEPDSRYNLRSMNTNAPPPTDVVNIGNGVNRVNTVVVDDRENSGYGYVNPPTSDLANRYGTRPNPSSTRTVNNIGNGYGNRNTVAVTNGQRTTNGQHGEAGRPNTGTSFATQSRQGTDYYHVGYGVNNQNKVTLNGKPVPPIYSNSKGSTYVINGEHTAGAGEKIYVYNSGTPQPPTIEKQLNDLRIQSQETQKTLHVLYQTVAEINQKFTSRCS